MGITHYLHSKGPFWGSWLCDQWTPDSLAISRCLFPCFHQLPIVFFPQHHVTLHLATISVCRHLLWTDFPSLWCQPPFLHWWYTYICLWFWASFVFLGLAGIKSLMFQNHIQLKLCKTEFLLMSSLKLPDTIHFSLLVSAFADLQFHFKGISRGLSVIDNCFSWSHLYGNLSFVIETLLGCGYFSPLLRLEAFQSWFKSFRLNYWETQPFPEGWATPQ